MPINYSEIARENEREYGAGIDNFGRKLLADRYSDPAHFVFELLQNAEDALGERLRLTDHSTLPKVAKFNLFKDRLQFRHYGIPFSENHIRAICNIACSSKQEASGAIGRFGIGFKSVYAFTRSPEIHSCGESFVIESLVRPAAVEPKPTAKGETLFVLPFNHKETSSDESHSIIAERLRVLGPRTLLFLRHIDEVDWEIQSSGSGRYLRESRTEAEGVEHITLVGEQRGKEMSKEHWLMFSRDASNGNGGSGVVKIAYQLQQTNKGQRGQIRRTKESPLCVYFATDLQTNLGFLVQGPFHLTQNRDNIRREDKWNKALAREVGKLTVDSLSYLKQSGLLSVSALDAMPLEREAFETDTGKLFLPVYEAVLDTLKWQALFPGVAKRWVSGNDGLLVRGRELTDLFTREQIQLLFGYDALPDWISPDLTADKLLTRKLHSYIRDALEVDELDAESICSKLDDEFFKTQRSKWFSRFYRFLLKHPTLWSEGRELRYRSIIRLADGSNVPPFGPDGAANAFLPTKQSAAPRTVDPKCATGDALTFLQRLGIRERDAVAVVLEDTLPMYEAGKAPTESAHVRNLGRIFSAFGQRGCRDHDKLLARLKETAFLRATNARTGKRGMQSPSSLLYFESPQLRNYFKGQPDAWLLAEPLLTKKAKHREMLGELGVAEAPSLISDWHGREQEVERWLDMIEAGGRLEGVTDYNVHGLESVLKRIRKQAKDSPKEATFLAKSLWIYLCSLSVEGGNPFEGCVRWKRKRHQRVEEDVCDAHFLKILRKETWLPDRNGHFRKPGELQERDLAPGFERDQKLCAALQFRTPLSEKLKGAGIPTKFSKVLELAQSDPQFADEFVSTWKKRGETAASAVERSVGQKARVGDGLSGYIDMKAFGRPDPASNIQSGVPTLHSGAATQSDSMESIDGSIASKQTGVRSPRTDHLQTRVRVESGAGTQWNCEDPEMAEARSRIDKAGVWAAKAFEEMAGRSVTEMSHSHPGYDLESRNQTGEVLRYIEVKSTGSAWNGVLLSSTQYRKAQELGNQYWLYVVENADSANPQVYPIPNPTGLIEKFVFDCGWKAVSMAIRALGDSGTGALHEGSNSNLPTGIENAT